jgi:hypothetical protein
MKLFFLLIPFLGINCISSAFAHKKEQQQPVEKKEAVSYQMLPGNLLFTIN